MFDLLDEATGSSGAAATLAWARIENAACARRLAGMVTMLDTRHAADGSANRDQWYLDNWAAVCAEIGARQGRRSARATRGSGVALNGWWRSGRSWTDVPPMLGTAWANRTR